jgi:hypothetical protein
VSFHEAVQSFSSIVWDAFVSWMYANIREVQYKHHTITIQHMTSCLFHVKEALELNIETGVWFASR